MKEYKDFLKNKNARNTAFIVFSLKTILTLIDIGLSFSVYSYGGEVH